VLAIPDWAPVQVNVAAARDGSVYEKDCVPHCTWKTWLVVPLLNAMSAFEPSGFLNETLAMEGVLLE
jgi:hypothetical protein